MKKTGVAGAAAPVKAKGGKMDTVLWAYIVQD